MSLKWIKNIKLILFLTARINVGFIAVFTIEMVIRMFGTGFKRYFKKGWNIFDIIIITLSYVSIYMLFVEITGPLKGVTTCI